MRTRAYSDKDTKAQARKFSGTYGAQQSPEGQKQTSRADFASNGAQRRNRRVDANLSGLSAENRGAPQQFYRPTDDVTKGSQCSCERQGLTTGGQPLFSTFQTCVTYPSAESNFRAPADCKST